MSPAGAHETVPEAGEAQATARALLANPALADYRIREHYELPSSFYELWLDPTMAYTCALWEWGDDLEAAQVRKLDWLIRAAGVRHGDRVLDVGCGWGGMLRRLVEVAGASAAVGLTISAEQARYVGARLAELDEAAARRISVRVESWEHHRTEAPYDAIVSAGAFEHFARRRATRDARLATYTAFFRRCHELLAPGAMMSLQTVAKAGARLDRAAVEDFRVIDEAFPESAIPWPAEVLIASERFFDMRECVFHDRHYVTTLREWRRRLAAVSEPAVKLVGGEVYDLWGRYLAAAERRFEAGHTTLMRAGLRRV
jgi:cyclopropane-fatty-acyl-phospholipid synthase